MYTRKITLFFACLLLTACQYYGVNFTQGNVLSAEQYQQIKVGMTREQVLDLLGSPVYENTFVRNTWVYVYTKQIRKQQMQKKVRLIFSGNQLVRIDR